MYRNWQYGYALHTASLTFLPVRLLHMGWREGISRFDFLSFSFGYPLNVLQISVKSLRWSSYQLRHSPLPAIQHVMHGQVDLPPSSRSVVRAVDSAFVCSASVVRSIIS